MFSGIVVGSDKSPGIRGEISNCKSGHNVLLYWRFTFDLGENANDEIRLKRVTDL